MPTPRRRPPATLTRVALPARRHCVGRDRRRRRPAADTAPATDDLPPAGADQSGPQPRVRKIDGPDTEPVDLAGVAGPAILKRLAPVLVVLLVALIVLRRRR